MTDYFDTLDIHPSIADESLAYINKLLGDDGIAQIKYNPHDFGEYLTIEVSRYDFEPDEPDEDDATLNILLEKWQNYDTITDKLNNACEQWRNKYADKVEKLYNN